MAETVDSSISVRNERPQVVVVFVTALVSFSIATWVVFYPWPLLRASLGSLPIVGLFLALFALSVWNGSRLGWSFNVLVWTRNLLDSVGSLRSWEGPPPYDESFASSANYELLSLVGAAAFLILLWWPSFFRWVWRRERLASRPAVSTMTSAST